MGKRKVGERAKAFLASPRGKKSAREETASTSECGRVLATRRRSRKGNKKDTRRWKWRNNGHGDCNCPFRELSRPLDLARAVSSATVARSVAVRAGRSKSFDAARSGADLRTRSARTVRINRWKAFPVRERGFVRLQIPDDRVFFRLVFGKLRDQRADGYRSGRFSSQR